MVFDVIGIIVCVFKLLVLLVLVLFFILMFVEAIKEGWKWWKS